MPKSLILGSLLICNMVMGQDAFYPVKGSVEVMHAEDQVGIVRTLYFADVVMKTSRTLQTSESGNFVIVDGQVI